LSLEDLVFQKGLRLTLRLLLLQLFYQCFCYYHYQLRYHYRCHHCYHHHLMLCAIGLYMYCRRRKRNDCFTITITINGHYKSAGLLRCLLLLFIKLQLIQMHRKHQKSSSSRQHVAEMSTCCRFRKGAKIQNLKQYRITPTSGLSSAAFTTPNSEKHLLEQKKGRSKGDII